MTGSSVEKSQLSTASSRRGSEPNIDPELKGYSDEWLQVCSLIYGREPMKGPPSMFHDYIVVVGHTQSRMKLSLIIKAEKGYFPDKERPDSSVSIEFSHLVARGRIDVIILKSLPEQKHEWCEVEMAGCGMIQVSELQKILTNHMSRYSLWRNNCWKYATDIFKALLNRFIMHPETDPQRRIELERELANFKGPSLPATYIKWIAMASIAVGAVAFVFEMMTDAFTVHCACTTAGKAALGCIYWAPNLTIAVVGVLVILSAYILYRENHTKGSLRRKCCETVEAAIESGINKMAEQIYRCEPFSRMVQQMERSVEGPTCRLDMSAVQQAMQCPLFRSSAEALMQNPAMSEMLARLRQPDDESHGGSGLVEVLDDFPDWEGIAAIMQSTRVYPYIYPYIYPHNQNPSICGDSEGNGGGHEGSGDSL